MSVMGGIVDPKEGAEEFFSRHLIIRSSYQTYDEFMEGASALVLQPVLLIIVSMNPVTIHNVGIDVLRIERRKEVRVTATYRINNESSGNRLSQGNSLELHVRFSHSSNSKFTNSYEKAHLSIRKERRRVYSFF